MNKLIYHLPKSLGTKLISFLYRKKVGESSDLREYYKKVYKVDVGMYSYGGCFSPDFNMGGVMVNVGSYCSMANDIHYFGANHPMKNITSSAYFYNKSFSGLEVNDVPRSTLDISDDVWIGYGVIITNGCHSIGRGSVIGAGSIVTKDVPPYAIVAGNPAHLIKSRFNDAEIESLESSRWWTKKPSELFHYYEFMDDPIAFVEKLRGE